MANLTITVDDEVLKKARIRALEQGTSVNAVLADRLRAFARGADTDARASRGLLSLVGENRERGGKSRAKQRGRRSWSRDDLHGR